MEYKNQDHFKHFLSYKYFSFIQSELHLPFLTIVSFLEKFYE